MASSAALHAGPPAAMPAAVRVVLIDGATAHLRYLRSVLRPATGFHVVGETTAGPAGAALVARLAPAAVLLDLDLSGGAGLRAVEAIMALSPTPIVAFTTGPRRAEALAAGAAAVVPRPRVPGSAAAAVPVLGEFAAAVQAALRLACRVRVITHPRGRLAAPPQVASPPALAASPPALAAGPPALAAGPPAANLPAARPPVRLIVIGASTGGPAALATVLAALPAGFGVPVLVVQHMAPGFLAGFAEWLDKVGPLRVAVGQAGQRLRRATVTLAPEGRNTVVDAGLRLRCDVAEPGQLHVPSVDATFLSTAEAFGPAAIGVVLTGMGRDGTVGLRRMRARGARTFGQDEATCTVFGMPASAQAAGAVEQLLPLGRIAPALVQALVSDEK